MLLKIKKGLDLQLVGAVESSDLHLIDAHRCAVTPDDFPGFEPKLDVKEGDFVSVGTALMHHKKYPSVCLVSPISGKVSAVVRGERRKIERVIVEAKGENTAVQFDINMPIVDLLCASGLFAMIRRRPYDVIPNPEVRPRDIFVTAFDSAPLAYDIAVNLGDDAKKVLDTAVKALKSVTDGNIYISHDSSWRYGDLTGAEMVEVEGPHPAGNVGVQIANIAPVNKGENVWTLDVVALYKIGKLLLTGSLDTRMVVAVTGPEIAKPSLVSAPMGCDIKPVIAGLLQNSNHHIRIISGNVLTGVAVNEADGFLHFPYRQVTVIAEGDDVNEFMGWASMSSNKLSSGRTFPFGFLRKLFTPDARLLGGRRAMIMSGEYDKVLPMDIMAEFLLKAIISRNIDEMEALGIYEVAPEDFALCEFVDTSKLPIQQIVRDGLNYLRRELE